MSKAQYGLCVLCQLFRASGLQSACVGHLTFVLREYQDNLLVGTALCSGAEVKCQKSGSDLVTNFSHAGTIYISGLNYFDLRAWSCCVSAQEKQFTISSQIQHGWHWTLAQIQETKSNRSTPRQMRKKDPATARPENKVLWQVRLLRIIPAIDTPPLFSVEHEFHFDVI